MTKHIIPTVPLLCKEWYSESLTLKLKVNDVDDVAEGRPPKQPAKASKNNEASISTTIIAQMVKFQSLILKLNFKDVDDLA